MMNARNNGYDNRENNNYNSYNSMYPEVYHQFMPVAEQVIRDMESRHGDNIYLNNSNNPGNLNNSNEMQINEDMLNQMVNEAIRRSANMPPNANANAASVPTITMMDYGRDHDYGHGHGHDPDPPHWSGYGRSALSDIYRILLLQQLFGGRGHGGRGRGRRRGPPGRRRR